MARISEGHVSQVDKTYGAERPDQASDARFLESVTENIKFSRVKILEVTELAYRVEFVGKEYEITKDEESHFESFCSGPSGLSGGMGLSLRQTLELVQAPGIFQDENAPEEFMEAMMLHEIREKEYAEAGFDDAHDRAVHDEMLYALKYFDPEKRQEYFDFAEAYRARAQELAELKREDEEAERERAESPSEPIVVITPERVAEIIEKLKLEEQYAKRLETLTTYEFIKSLENTVIEGVDGKNYPAPTLEQIIVKLTPEKAGLIEKYIKKPMLLIVPFAMPLKSIAEKAGAKKGKLEQKPVYTGYGMESDLPDRSENGEQLIYFPKQYDQIAHGGFTKSEVLSSSGAHNTFPGWQVLVVDGTETTPEDTRNKSAIDLKVEFDSLGLSGLTCEEWLTLHAEGAFKGIPFDVLRLPRGVEKSETWNLAAYLKNRYSVPSSYWSPAEEHLKVILSIERPDNFFWWLGSRRAVRL